MSQMNKKNGFTLIEMIIVIALMAILALTAIPVITGYQTDAKLASTASRIISTLRYSQNKSIVGEGTSTWGVHFDTTSSHFFSIFQGSSYASGTNTEPVYLTDGVSLSNISITGGGNDIIFTRLTGKTSTDGSGTGNRAVCVTLSSDSSACKKGIVVKSNGKISLQ